MASRFVLLLCLLVSSFWGGAVGGPLSQARQPYQSRNLAQARLGASALLSPLKPAPIQGSVDFLKQESLAATSAQHSSFAGTPRAQPGAAPQQATDAVLAAQASSGRTRLSGAARDASDTYSALGVPGVSATASQPESSPVKLVLTTPAGNATLPAVWLKKRIGSVVNNAIAQRQDQGQQGRGQQGEQAAEQDQQNEQDRQGQQAEQNQQDQRQQDQQGQEVEQNQQDQQNERDQQQQDQQNEGDQQQQDQQNEGDQQQQDQQTEGDQQQQDQQDHQQDEQDDQQQQDQQLLPVSEQEGQRVFETPGGPASSQGGGTERPPLALSVSPPAGAYQPRKQTPAAEGGQHWLWDPSPSPRSTSPPRLGPDPEVLARSSVAAVDHTTLLPVGRASNSSTGGAASGTKGSREEDGTDLGGTTTTVVAVVASVGGASLAAVCAFLALRRLRRRRQMIQQGADPEMQVPAALQPHDSGRGPSAAFLGQLVELGKLQVAPPAALPVPAAPSVALDSGPKDPQPPMSPGMLSPLSSLTSDAWSPRLPGSSNGSIPISSEGPAGRGEAAAGVGATGVEPSLGVPSDPSAHSGATSWGPTGAQQSSAGAAAASASAGEFGFLGAGEQWGQGAGTAIAPNPRLRGGPSLPSWSSGVIRPEQVQILARREGVPWMLGRGSSGTVYKGLLDGVQPVAVKVVQGMGEARMREAFVREVMLLRGCRDRNVVQFLGASLSGPQSGPRGSWPISEGEAMLVTEFMELGDLWKLATLRNAVGQRVFGWHCRGRRIALDVACGLHYLHSRRVVHLDLKSANILVARDGTAKLADVGFSRVLTRSFFSVSNAMGTFAWSAPEVLQGQRCTERSDIYSYGVVLWEIATGQTPVRGDMRDLRVPEECPAEVADLYRCCTALDPARRPTAREIVEVLQGLGPGHGSQYMGAEGELMEQQAAQAGATAEESVAGLRPGTGRSRAEAGVPRAGSDFAHQGVELVDATSLRGEPAERSGPRSGEGTESSIWPTPAGSVASPGQGTAGTAGGDGDPAGADAEAAFAAAWVAAAAACQGLLP